MSVNCKSCGRVMTKPEDFYGGDLDSQYCSSCTNADGSLKNLDEITLHIANQLIMSQGIDREAATKAARSILSVQPEWRDKLRTQEGRKTWKTKFLLTSLSVLLVVTLGVVWLVWPRERTIYWDVPTPTDKVLGLDVKPEYIKSNHDGVEVTQVSIPEDQYNTRIDKNDGSVYFCDYVHSQTGYRLEFDNKPFEKTVAIDRVAAGQQSNFLYVGSIAKDFSTDNLRIFWVTSDEKNNWVLMEGLRKSDQYEQIAENVDPFSVVVCGKSVVWLQKDDSNNSSVKVFNVETSKVYEVEAPNGFKSDLKAGDNVVFWSDYGDASKQGFEVVGYDFDRKTLIKTGLQSVFPGEKSKDSRFVGKLESKLRAYETNIPDNWFVTGDCVFMSNYNDQSKIMSFNYKINVLENIDCGWNTSNWKSRRMWSSWDNCFYLTDVASDELLGGDFSEGKDNQRIAWLNAKGSLPFKQNYRISTFKLEPKGQSTIKTIKMNGFDSTYIDFFKITGDWLIWLTQTEQLNDQDAPK
ncbi:MAG: hypothetical protein KA140_04580 [Caldisericia bacterium]|nr:hypothetical protein [Caldisericia bacterium]